MDVGIIKRLNPDKLTTTLRDGITSVTPIEGRKYTLTHSDITAELFLDIGKRYAVEKIGAMRDEVLGKWCYTNQYHYCAYVLVDQEYDPVLSEMRNKIFMKELPLALEAIRFGDKIFFEAHPALNKVPIWIYFSSANPKLNRVENFGTFQDYR